MSHKDDKALTPDLEGGKSSLDGTQRVPRSAEAGVSSTAGTLLAPRDDETGRSSDDDVSSILKGFETPIETGNWSTIDILFPPKGVEAGISSQVDSGLVPKVQAEGSSRDETPLAPEGVEAAGSSRIDIPLTSTSVKAEELLNDILLTGEGIEAGEMAICMTQLLAESIEIVDESVGIGSGKSSRIDVLSALQDVTAGTLCGFSTESPLEPSSKVRPYHFDIALAPEGMETGGPHRIDTSLTRSDTEGGGPSWLDLSLTLPGTLPSTEAGGPSHRGGPSPQDRTDGTRDSQLTLQLPGEDSATLTVDEIRERKGKKKVED